jgi:hypothetical protein
MAIWKLLPLKLHSPDWKLSTYQGEVIVRAQNEREARMRATLKFATGAKANVKQTTKLNPWNRPDAVSCEVLTGSEYQEQGDSKVLFPGDH